MGRVSDWCAARLMWLLRSYAAKRAGPRERPKDEGAMYFAALADVLEAGLHLREDADIAATADLVRGISRLNVIRAYLQPKSEAAVNAVLGRVQGPRLVPPLSTARGLPPLSAARGLLRGDNVDR